MKAATRPRRSHPVVFITGCTGTGKTDLGVALAEKFNGEVISCDSMQIYKGLDIATNKATKEEMRGIPHHLMSFVDPSSSSSFNGHGFTVHEFLEMALDHVSDIHSRGKVPFVVGGTAYYLEHLLLKGRLVKASKNSEEIIDELDKKSSEELYRELQEVDPGSASRLHPNQRSRVMNSIRVSRLSGNKHSELLADQNPTLRFSNSLLLYLDADIEVLDARLDKRVGKMHTSGLREEVEDFYDKHKAALEADKFGIMQAIGLKEFLDYARLDPSVRRTPEGDAAFSAACESVQQRTRKYSRKQRTFVRSHLMVHREQDPSFARIDTSDGKSFIPEGISIMERWLDGEDFLPGSLFRGPPRQDANTLFECEICEKQIHGGEQYQKHLHSRLHRKQAARHRRRLDCSE